MQVNISTSLTRISEYVGYMSSPVEVTKLGATTQDVAGDKT